MECDPVVKADVASVAVAGFPLSVPVPRVVTPSTKVTVPVGMEVPGDTSVTVAVKVTLSPGVEGFALDTSVVVVVESTTKKT
jgi:hypothetical protein